MLERNVSLLTEAIMRNALAVLSVPSGGMLRHHKTRLLAETGEGFWIEAPAADHLRIDELIQTGKTVGITFRDGPNRVAFTTPILLRNPCYSNGRVTPLHSYWDAIFGTKANTRNVERLAAAILADPKLSRDALAAKLARGSYLDWIIESRNLAESFAYRDVQGVTKEQIRLRPEHDAPDLPKGYAVSSRVEAIERAVLAGDRLADKLADIIR